MNLEELKRRCSIYKKKTLCISIDTYQVEFMKHHKFSPSKVVNKLLEEFIDKFKDGIYEENIDEIKNEK